VGVLWRSIIATAGAVTRAFPIIVDVRLACSRLVGNSDLSHNREWLGCARERGPFFWNEVLVVQNDIEK
jgi:hypothetical protein